MTKNNNLVIFWGPAGCGKTTLIFDLLKIYDTYRHIDLVSYYRKYKNEAFAQALEDIRNLELNVFFEVGTSFHEFKVERIAAMSESRNILHLLCLLDEKICFSRAKLRQETDPAWTPSKALEQRYRQGYPLMHLEILKKHRQRFHSLQMDLPSVCLAAKEKINNII